ncbi:protein kinase [Oscillochloris sp. ZM17-4]|uniref:serine/threonine-protein kinase n=1 Tax=Oscillochloris sp. ZM17-4 TaxID=2866714 RepID=UPI001C7361C3|nr:serine/threonine-protein kinase [Oscillochloris sp. ZM17-4]MBX0328140.1 protein kinase [Oscillochloris sp. ZM17-4]
MHPSSIGRYQIIAEIGRGGMATVYLAQDPQVGRQVAVKLLPREFLHDPEFRARFLREARAVVALDHPAIVPIYDLGEQDGQPFLVMRYMSGGSLAGRLRNGPLALPDAARVIQSLALALDEAHTSGIIHRDIKPANILFDQRDAPYLSDFGIARLSEATAQLTGSGNIGTPDYMAPEISRPGGLTALVDVYALGVTLFQMLSGRLPYQADTPLGVLVAHITEPIPDIGRFRPELPADWVAVVNRALAKDPAARHQSAGALAADLRQLLDAPAPVTRRISAPSAIEQPQGRQPTVVAEPRTPPIPSAAAPAETVYRTARPNPRRQRVPPPVIGAAIVLVLALIWIRWAAVPGGASTTTTAGGTPAAVSRPAASNWPTPAPAPAARPPLPTVIGEVQPLPYRVLDAAYSPAIDRLLLIQESTASLFIVNPIDGSTQEVDLPKPATALAISRDGARAAIGHDARVTIVDLRSGQVEKSLELSAQASSLVLADNNRVYVSPARDQWSAIHAIDLSSGREVLGQSNQIYAQTQLALGPDSASLYTADRGLSPSDIAHFDISGDAPVALYDSPYHGDYEMCGDLWVAPEGHKIVTACANVFRAAPERERDMTYTGSLSPLKGVADAAFVTETGTIAALPRFAYADEGRVADQNEVYFFEYETLNPEGVVTLPDFKSGVTTYRSYGRHIFASGDGKSFYVIVQTGRPATEPKPTIGYVPAIDDPQLPQVFGLVRLSTAGDVVR